MANGSPPTIETLSAIVENHTRQFTTLHEEVANVAQRQETLFGQLSAKMDEQRRDTEARRSADNAQQLAALAGNKPDIKGIVIAVATVAGLFITFATTVGYMALSPIRESLTEQKSDTKSGQDLQQRRNLAMEAATTKVSDDLVKARIELATLVGLETERHEVYLKDEKRHEAREDGIDGALIKRPEIQGMVAGLDAQVKSGALAANDRITAVIGSLNELRHDVGTNYTTGDALKGAFERMDKFQTQLNELHSQLTMRGLNPPSVKPPD